MFIIKLKSEAKEVKFNFLYEVANYCNISVPSLYNQIYCRDKLSSKIDYLKVNEIEVPRDKRY